MIDADVPPWITVVPGRAPLLLLAPHGGRRHDVRVPGKHKVNDLLTAELTRELASACGASVVINEHLDRNQLDLNRLSQVRREAPWLVRLLADMLGAMVAEAGHATVLVIHGWNVTQAACDVGIGMRDVGGDLVSVRPDSATASERFVADRLRPLQAMAAEDGIAVTIGSRYPAAHPNNLLQIFRAIDDGDAVAPCALAALCRTAAIEAAQLELAIPLRWPGQRRERFLMLLSDVFAEGPARRAPRRTTALSVPLRTSTSRVTRRCSLQFHAGELLVMAGIDAGEAGPVAGRLLVSADRDHLALFTGELADPAVAWTVPPLSFEPSEGNGSRVFYEGPLVRFPSLTPFLDLERGLAGGALIEGRLDVTFRPDRVLDAGESGETFGEVRGTLCIDHREYAIAARGVRTAGEGPRPQRLPSCRVTLTTGPWGSLILGASGTPLERHGSRLVGVLLGPSASHDGSRAMPARCEIELGDHAGTIVLAVDDRPERIHADLDRLIPVRRPGRDDTVVETIFAIIRAGDACIGWAEVSATKDVLGDGS